MKGLLMAVFKFNLGCAMPMMDMAAFEHRQQQIIRKCRRWLFLHAPEKLTPQEKKIECAREQGKPVIECYQAKDAEGKWADDRETCESTKMRWAESVGYEVANAVMEWLLAEEAGNHKKASILHERVRNMGYYIYGNLRDGGHFKVRPLVNYLKYLNSLKDDNITSFCGAGVANLIYERCEARANLEYRRADKLRAIIEAKGYDITDMPGGGIKVREIKRKDTRCQTQT